ncbi:hypothetical protein CCZ28_21990 [Pseudomonas oryzihabitans]|nr:hypothetical protein CCZ28_21990 [Pseudomonas psychrotolerans]
MCLAFRSPRCSLFASDAETFDVIPCIWRIGRHLLYRLLQLRQAEVVQVDEQQRQGEVSCSSRIDDDGASCEAIY